MGTSVSSNGPGSGVSLVPPWVPSDDHETPEDATDDNSPEGTEDPNTEDGQDSTLLAPERRFKAARTSLGNFSRTGSSNSLKKGLGHYVRFGLGGTRRATQRMEGTARKTSVLYGVLDALRSGTVPPVDLGIDPITLSGQPARAIADRIAQAISPSDGTQDAEASRTSISLALTELTRRDPQVNLTTLDENQIALVTELYISYDICQRADLDIGKAIWNKAPTPVVAVQRHEEMRNYIFQSVAACFRHLRTKGQILSRHSAILMARQVIKDTFYVFEVYLR